MPLPSANIPLASALGMSQRSFQRKPSELGLSYQKVLDEIRHELARHVAIDLSRQKVCLNNG